MFKIKTICIFDGCMINFKIFNQKILDFNFAAIIKFFSFNIECLYRRSFFIINSLISFKIYCNENKAFENVFTRINSCSEQAKQTLLNNNFVNQDLGKSILPQMHTFPHVEVCMIALLRRTTGPENCTKPYGFLLYHIAVPRFLEKWKVAARVFQFPRSNRTRNTQVEIREWRLFTFPEISEL